MRYLLRRWWQTPVDDPWIVEFMISRGLLGLLKFVVGTCGAALGVIAVLSSLSVAGPHNTVGNSVSALIASATVWWTIRWWFGSWPTPRTSLGMLVLADIAIGVGCAVDSNALAGLTGTTLFVLTGAYVTFFHNPKVHAVHVVWAVLCVGGLALRLVLSPDGDLPLALAKALIAGIVVVGVMPVLHFGLWLVSTDAVDSWSDPLTGVLNRRGLAYHYAKLKDASRTRHGEEAVCVIAMDLDRFKAVNDRWGHSTGDEVLVRTAGRIRSTVRGVALVARTGGEEFVAVDILPLDSVLGIVERIRLAIAEAADDITVTASFGAVVAAIRDLEGMPGLEQLLDQADAAMYVSKRAGGDRVTVRSFDPSLPHAATGARAEPN